MFVLDKGLEDLSKIDRGDQVGDRAGEAITYLPHAYEHYKNDYIGVIICIQEPVEVIQIILVHMHDHSHVLICELFFRVNNIHVDKGHAWIVNLTSYFWTCHIETFVTST
jgi:hypothetical protein